MTVGKYFSSDIAWRPQGSALAVAAVSVVLYVAETK